MFDEDIAGLWCLGITWRCTLAEATGLWMVVLFYSSVLIVTVIHGIQQAHTGMATRNDEVSRRHNATDGGEWRMMCALLVYFYIFAAGTFIWVSAGVGWVHPFQIWWLQLLGSAILAVCMCLFVIVHVDMGDSWSPEPEAKARHHLVTTGTFAWARHPMYAIFLWGFIGTLLATLNWLIAWIVFGTVMMTFARIETEERILVELFGGQYLEYRRRVSALGPPWRCLGYDREEGWPILPSSSAT